MTKRFEVFVAPTKAPMLTILVRKKTPTMATGKKKSAAQLDTSYPATKLKLKERLVQKVQKQNTLVCKAVIL